MVIKAGYKQTEIGIIPNDWTLECLDNVANVIMGQSPLGNSYNFNEGIPLLNGPTEFGNIHPQPIQFTTKPTKVSKINDILLCVRGSTTGRLNISNQEYCIGRGLASIRGKINKTDTTWLFYQFKKLQSYILHISSGGGSTFPNLNRDSIKKILLPFPPLKEQKKISQTLSDCDKLIFKILKLLEKKKNIKQGTMQELLTGKRRLDGFSDEWNSKLLGDMLDFEQPTKYLVKNTEYNDVYNTPVLTAGKTFILGYTDEEDNIFQNLPVIIFDDFTTSSKYVDFSFKGKSSAMKILKAKNEKVDLKFIFEKIQLINFPVGTHKRHWISEFSNLLIKTPEYEEQYNISQILSDMSLEIKKLETQKNKYIMIKEGMMQKLLTGEIRIK